MGDAQSAHKEATRSQEEPDLGSAAGTPRWVKIAGVIVIALVLLFVVLKLTGVGGDHGPGRHGGPSGDPPPAGVTEHTPPPGVDHE